MPGKIVKDLSANTVQVVTNQVLGLLIFYITSTFLSKELFGELNWTIATAALLITIISGGLELIIVKKIAQGENIRRISGLHLIHVIYTGFIIIAIAIFVYLFCSSAYPILALLPGIVISQTISYFSSPFKQIANGSSEFSKLSVILVMANWVKLILLIIFIIYNILSLKNILLLFVIAAVTELLIAYILMAKNTSYQLFPLYWNKKDYLSLLKEALPQYGVTIFNLVLARFDWILLGLLSSTIITAEYSFAYKVFELTRLPLLIISPILLPLFAKAFYNSNFSGAKKKLQLSLLFRAEMIVSILLPLILISCWSPLMDSITNGKYGRVNESTFAILCSCVPLQFATDFYWNLCFAKNQLSTTLKIAVISGSVNILLNILLIPFYSAEGAAIAYIVCFLVQLFLFKFYAKQDETSPDIFLLIKTIACAGAALTIVYYTVSQPILATLLAIILYVIFCITTRLIVPRKIKPTVALLLNRKK